jgi:RimJ/RimL family protein N-acetyltransferase
VDLPDSPVAVSGSGLVLRAFEASDRAALMAAFADEEIARWNPGPAGDGDAAEEWAGKRNDWTPATHASWAIGADGGGLLGSVSLHRIDWDQGDAEIGYWVGPQARGRGVASTAVRLATRFGFDRLHLHRVYLFHAVENLGSCGVARRSGFTLEGTLRQSHRFADGAYHDEHLHGRLAADADGAVG